MNRYEWHELDDDDDDSVHFRWRENTDCGVWERIRYGLLSETKETLGRCNTCPTGEHIEGTS